MDSARGALGVFGQLIEDYERLQAEVAAAKEDTRRALERAEQQAARVAELETANSALEYHNGALLSRIEELAEIESKHRFLCEGVRTIMPHLDALAAMRDSLAGLAPAAPGPDPVGSIDEFDESPQED